MRTLFVTYHYLHGNGGGVFASRGYVNAFAELSEHLTLLCPVKDGAMPEGIREGVRIVPVPYEKPQWVKYLHLLAGRIHRYFGVFGKTLASDRFDTVVFDACYASFRLIDRARRAGCRVIVIHHNSQCDYVRANYRFPVRGPMLFWTRRSEREAVLGSDLNLVLTPDDGVQLRHLYDKEGRTEFGVVGVFEYRRQEPLHCAPVQKPVFVITGCARRRNRCWNGSGPVCRNCGPQSLPPRSSWPGRPLPNVCMPAAWRPASNSSPPRRTCSPSWREAVTTSAPLRWVAA